MAQIHFTYRSITISKNISEDLSIISYNQITRGVSILPTIS